MNKPRLSFWQIWNMSFGFLGIQFGWGLQMANMSPIYKTLGAEESSLPYLWLAGPLTGLLVQPIIGAWSDRTWTRLGRRRPFFLVGAIFSSLALLAMPHSGTVWMAAGLLWILDAAINTTMEPFRAFVGDKLPEEQRTGGFVMQSFFIGVGQTAANAFPWILGTYLGVKGATNAGIPLTTYYSFLVGALVFLGAVLWTVCKTTEEPSAVQGHPGTDCCGQIRPRSGFAEILAALSEMPKTMKQLAVVQFFTWFSFPCMWQFFGIAVARHVFGAESGTQEFEAGTNWGGLCFAAYNVVCFAVAFLIPVVAGKLGRKATHALCLSLGGLGLLGVFFCTTPNSLLLPMVGVGIAWSSILSLPYAILAGAIPASRMGLYMGVFNLFIVLPQVVMSLIVPRIYKTLLGDDPRNVVMLGGCVLLVAAISVALVQDQGSSGRTSTVSS